MLLGCTRNPLPNPSPCSKSERLPTRPRRLLKLLEGFGGRPSEALVRPRCLKKTNKRFRASARNPKRNKVGWMPASAAGGGKNRLTYQLLVCWATEMSRRKTCRSPPHTPGCVGAPFLHVPPSARRPKP